MEELKYGLLIGILSNHGISSQKAWDVPNQLSKRLYNKYGLSLAELDKLSIEDVMELYNYPTKLHRFNNKMAMYARNLIKGVNEMYEGDFKRLFPVDNNLKLIDNVSKLPGMSEKKAKHLLVYLCALDKSYTITNDEYLQYTKDCPQLVERFEENITILKRIQS